MNFATALQNESTKAYTENGAAALNTTGDARLDLFGTIGALREADETRIQRLFAESYKQDPLFTTKIVFYGRDIRGGAGERETFRKLIHYMAKCHPESIRPNLDLIGVYGRYDDLYALMDTPLETEMWGLMKPQLEEDRKNMEGGKAVSLLAKWLKTADASSAKTRALGIKTALKLGYTVYEYKRIVRALRKHIGVIEGLMSTGQWDKIQYPNVLSRAMMIYREAFRKHDEERFDEFTNKALKGEVKINSSALFPYDIITKCFGGEDNDVLEVQWRQLPNYIEPGTNILVVADVSGSMQGRPMATSIGLAIYFAERNTGAYSNLFMTFSEKSEIGQLKGETLQQKVENLKWADWGMNTNLCAAFEHVLNVAMENHVPAEEMPKALVVISDMEIDACTRGDSRDWTFYDVMAARFAEQGYQLPNIVFWNVNSRHDIFHADSTKKGVQLVSGSSPSAFRNVVKCIGMNPVEMMEEVINGERYQAITVKDHSADVAEPAV